MVWCIRNPILLDPETSKPRYLPHRAAPGSSQFDGARQELRRDLDENYRGTPMTTNGDFGNPPYFEGFYLSDMVD